MVVAWGHYREILVKTIMCLEFEVCLIRNSPSTMVLDKEICAFFYPFWTQPLKIYFFPRCDFVKFSFTVSRKKGYVRRQDAIHHRSGFRHPELVLSTLEESLKRGWFSARIWCKYWTMFRKIPRREGVNRWSVCHWPYYQLVRLITREKGF